MLFTTSHGLGTRLVCGQLTEVDTVCQDMDDREGEYGPPSQFVELNVLVEGKQEGNTCGAKPCQPSSHHQNHHQYGVKVQTLATPTSY